MNPPSPQFLLSSRRRVRVWGLVCNLPGHMALAPAGFAQDAARSRRMDWCQNAVGCSRWQSSAQVLQLDCDTRLRARESWSALLHARGVVVGMGIRQLPMKFCYMHSPPGR